MRTELITKCTNNDCEKMKECVRFKIATGTEIIFKNICNSGNNFKWFWKIKKEIVSN